MKRFGLALLFSLLIGAASAQLGGGLMFPGPGTSHSAGGGAYVGPGDINGSAAYWYGLRGFSAAYASPGTNPAVDLVDQAGANAITINILTNGNLDVASIATWVTAHSVTTIRVSQLYDQTGGGNHVLQATLANMPVLTLSAIGSLPGMTFNGSTTYLATSSITVVGPAQPHTISYVAKRTTVSGGFEAVFGASGSTQVGFDSGANGLYIFAGNGPPAPLSATDNAFHAVQNIMNSTTSTISSDGTTSGSLNAGTSDLLSRQPTVGAANSSNSNMFTGVAMEAGVWAGNKSANTSTMNSNQHTYWGF